MIEVTNEMREYFNNELWDINIDHPEWEQHTSRVMKRIIELHEANKPTQKPLSDKQLATIITNAYRYDYTHYDLARTIEQAHGIGTSHEPT